MVISPYEQRALATRANASALDVVVGTSAWALGTAGALSQRATGVVRWLVRSTPTLPVPAQAVRLVDDLGQHGQAARAAILRDTSRLLDALVPMVADAVLRRLDLTAVVREHVDVEAVVATVDLDAVVSTVDLDAVAARLDLDAIVDRLDLTAIVRERVDLDELVALVDLDAVAARLDLDAAAQRLDLDAIVERLDLVGIAQEVINAIDLPEIIRESTGSVASETLRGVRMQGIAGDEAIGRVVDRLLLRRGRRSVHAPAPVSSNGDSAATEHAQPLEPLVPGFGPQAPDDIPDQRQPSTAEKKL